mmetsp:Transcript_25271/g.74321  ORF Transcript_25271/g.74321 Transcript_25271/m.74321 type:complete len:205 (-) Transcript_25271:342-956(-)
MERHRPRSLTLQFVGHGARRLIERRLAETIRVPSSELVVRYGAHAGAQIGDDRRSSLFLLLLSLVRSLPPRPPLSSPPLGAHQRRQSLRQHDGTDDIDRQTLRGPFPVDFPQRTLRSRRRLPAVAQYSRDVEQRVDAAVLRSNFVRGAFDRHLILHVQSDETDPLPLLRGKGRLDRFQGFGVPGGTAARRDSAPGTIQHCLDEL